MAILDHVVSTGMSPFAANAVVGSVSTLNSVSTATTQATAVLLGSGTGYIAICSSSGRAFQLPACGPGSDVFIFNNGAQTASIYGQTGDAIGGGSANAAFALATKKGAIFKRVTATLWGQNLTA